MQQGFLLTSEESELLVHFEEWQTIEKTANALHKDPSGVSRSLSAIAKKFPALEKRRGKWCLTEVGRRLNDITRASIHLQRQLLSTQTNLRIGTNREFSSRLLAPSLQALQAQIPHTVFSIQTYEHGVEEAILHRQIDIGIDCGQPYDPSIAYKRGADERISAVCSPEFFKRYQDSLRPDGFHSAPHLLCKRLHPDKRLECKTEHEQTIVAYFNDVASARAACISGLGWALLPFYAVETELSLGQLVSVDALKTISTQYGIWILREQKTHKEAAGILFDWLTKQSL